VIDDELLQELLAKATGLYNSGEYRAAIDAWKEALGVDSSSQKAQEGIQMATLLLGDWEPTAAIAAAPKGSTPPSAASRPADGAPAIPNDLTPDEIATRLDQGATRVRTLLRQRRYSEAVEGARSLVPIDPDSEEVQRLLEEAQQAFEAAPFIEEHLTLARELAAQERLEEAEAECKKVFALDPTNPDGHVLLMELRTRRANESRAQSSPRREPQASASMTMRIDATQLKGMQRSAAAAAQPAPRTPEPVAAVEPEPVVETAGDQMADQPAVAAPSSAAEALPDELFDFDPAAIDATAHAPRADALPLSEPGADDDLTVQGLDGDAGVPGPGASDAAAAATGDDTGSAEESGSAADDVHVIDDPEDGYVDAATVVPPAVRLVDRKGAPGPSVESLMGKLDDLEEVPLATRAAKPSGPAAKPATPAPGSWEQELTDLNRKTGQHDIVGRSAAKSPGRKAEPEGDVDLSALLGDELGDAADASSGAAHDGAETADDAAPSIPLDLPEPAPVDAAEDLELGAIPEVDAEPPAVEASAEPAPPPAEGRSRANLPIYFALLGVLILAIGAGVWWFFFQPRAAAGQVPPASTAPPPSSHNRAPATGDALPTPIGSTSRQTTQQHVAPTTAPATAPAAGSAPAAGASAAMAQPPAMPGAPPEPGTSTTPGMPLAPSAPAPSDAQGGHAAAPPASPAVAPAPTAPPPPRSLEEVKRESARHMAEGKRLMTVEKWQEAHAEFATVLALDPMSFESRELLDKTQVKIDQDLKVRKDLDEARHAFEDKDYQGALWKLYRLPHDPRLGDIDLRIRNAWFNWAVVGMKGGDAVDAKQKLTEVLQADPVDGDAKKMMEVAERYASRPKDRTFYSFVDTLRFRTFDQK
jgi:tetratricopeptide (TPR) repeat protein